jgi:hypothetical protein
MNTPTGFGVRLPSLRVRLFMLLAWIAIAGKCIFVSWAVERWHMPFSASWVVVPTLLFGALATGLWLTHQKE